MDCFHLVDRLRRSLDRRADAADVSSVIDVGYGSLTFNVDGLVDEACLDFINETVDHVRKMGGSLLVERCPIAVKKHVDVFGIDVSAAQIMKNMKLQFDRDHVLNPGRFAFRI